MSGKINIARTPVEIIDDLQATIDRLTKERDEAITTKEAAQRAAVDIGVKASAARRDNALEYNALLEKYAVLFDAARALVESTDLRPGGYVVDTDALEALEALVLEEKEGE